MKENKIIYTIIAAACITLALYGCDDMNELHSEYLKGERIYLGRPDSMRISPGKNKVKIEWWLNADPLVEKTVIYWNQETDSVVVPVNDESDYMSTVIENLEEASYVFRLINKNDMGLASLSVEESTAVYGDDYIGKLLNRSITNIEATAGKLVLSWGNVSPGMIYSHLLYKNNVGETKELIVPAEESETEITDHVLGGEVVLSTAYIPTENALEVFSIPYTFTFPVSFMMPTDNFSKVVLTNDVAGNSWGGAIEKLWNSNFSSGDYFHSGKDNVGNGADDVMPQTITMDLGTTAKVESFKAFPRTTSEGGNPRVWEIWGIPDIEGADTEEMAGHDNWENESTSKGWVRLTEIELAEDANRKAPYTVSIENHESFEKVRYIRMRFLESFDKSETSTCLTELQFFVSEFD